MTQSALADTLERLYQVGLDDFYRHRTAPEMRKIFERAGGQLGASNCVAWMFEPKGSFAVAAEVADEDKPAGENDDENRPLQETPSLPD